VSRRARQKTTPGRSSPWRLLVTLCLGLTLAGSQAASEPLEAGPIEVSVVQRRLNAEDPTLDRVGSLRFRGALELSSPDPRFGGFSGLLVSPDGRSLVAVSDRGHWLTARLSYDAQGRLVDLSEAVMVPLRDRQGRSLAESKRKGDAESLAELSDGSLLVAFEHDHRLLGYPAPAAGGAVAHWPAPSRLRAGSNAGLEALTVLPDGRWLAFHQGSGFSENGLDYRWGFLGGNGHWAALGLRQTGELKPVAAATLSAGDVVLMERQWSGLGGLRVRLQRLAAGTIAPGARLEGAELAELQPPLLVDNFEGLAARRGADSETLLYLLSDDNFNPLQRTLLLLFAVTQR
jgi:hypothetical protein